MEASIVLALSTYLNRFYLHVTPFQFVSPDSNNMALYGSSEFLPLVKGTSSVRRNSPNVTGLQNNCFTSLGIAILKELTLCWTPPRATAVLGDGST